METTAIGRGTLGVKKDITRKRLTLSFDGFFNDENSRTFQEEYEAAKKELGQSTTTLLIEASNLSTFPQKLVPASEFIYKDYANFKEIYIVEPKSAAAKMQLHNTLKRINVHHLFKFVDQLPA